ncbi:Sporulation protein RMD1 [Porphyridium purpureum]|uniref:Sporulation protein RMD1 n=1 Tax=Porphyridium purpureum TaxID=35688 RepID=A0A5J4Z0A2_PORPP|nr:Sporulation protein RMD1 [Porphyridium purpureum]|eukprot:POR4860..scf208_2
MGTTGHNAVATYTHARAPSSNVGLGQSVARAPDLANSISTSRFAAGAKTRLDRVKGAPAKPAAPVLKTQVGVEQEILPLHQWTGRLSAFCTCNTFNLKDVLHYFELAPEWEARRCSRDLLHVRKQMQASTIQDTLWWIGVEDAHAGAGELFIFEYGVMISWGFSEGAEWQLLDVMKNFEIGRLEQEVEFDGYDYTYFVPPTPTPLVLESEQDATLAMGVVDEMNVASPSQSFRIENDAFFFSATQTLAELLHCKLACTHAIAQSIKLSSFESAVEGIFKRVETYPVELAKTGTLRISDRQLLILSGELYTYSAYINLQTDVLDVVPDWFWDNSAYVPVFDRTQKYLDCKARVSVLNKRLSVVESMYALFRDERHISNNHRLEWIVIALIVVCIVLNLIQIFFLLTSPSVFAD